jgi:carbamoyltransferase
MYILGLGGSGHDFSACVCDNDKILGFIEDERITRIKHSFFLGNDKKISEMSSVFYLCNMLGIELSEFELVIANNIIKEEFYNQYIPHDKVIKINHHLSHASSAYFPSEFKSSAILIIDGAGDSYEEGLSETVSLWYGEDKRIINLLTHKGRVVPYEVYTDFSLPFENSIGGMYRVVTNLIGFGLFDEGKTMGIASYGSDKYYKQMRNLVDYDENGMFLMPIESYKKLIEMGSRLNTFQDKADFSYAAQKITNESVVNAAKTVKKLTGSENICIAGGVALNSVANYAIYKSKLFKHFFIQPAAGDDGTSIGASLYGAYQLKQS